MNILYIGAFRLPKYDAAAARVIALGKALKDFGHTISFVSWGGEYDEDHKSADGRYNVDGMEYRIVKEIDGEKFLEKLYLKIYRGDKSLKYIQTLDKKPDVILTYNTPYLFNRKLFKYCKQNDIKLVPDITEWYDSNELNVLDWIPNWLNMTRFYNSLSNIITISSYLANTYHSLNSIVVPALADCKEEKWQYINGATIDSFDGITLIYAGNPAKKDKLHLAVTAVQYLINEGAKIRFIIAGCDREKYVKVIKDLYPDLSLSPNIIFLGRIDQDKIPALYNQADFMVLLREKNRKSDAGFPTKFTESMMSGTPVICNLTSDLGNYIKDGYNGFIVNEDSVEACMETLKKKVLSLTPEEIHEMKINAKETGVKQLDYRVYKNRLNDFITNLV